MPLQPVWMGRRGLRTARPLAIPLLALSLFVRAPDTRARSRDEGWSRLESPHFELFSNARESEAERLLRDLETFRFVVSRFVGLTNPPSKAARVYFFRDEKSFDSFRPLYSGRPRAVKGFHVEDPLGHSLALCRDSREEATRRILFHEYTHLLLSQSFRAAPVWANEGVAEAFSTFEADEDTFTLGVALTNHVFYLQKHRPTPVADLLSVGRDSPDYNEAQRAGHFYATSWLLTHYLLFGQGGFQSHAMARYAALCAATTNQAGAFRSAFGIPAEALDGDLGTYLQGGRYTIVRESYSDLPVIRPKRLRLKRGELDLALGRLLEAVRRIEPARERLERAAREMRADPHPQEALAMLAWRTDDRDAARQRVEDAIRLGSREAFIYFLAAEFRYQSLSTPQFPMPARLAALGEGRQLCEQALRLDPRLAPAHHLLGVYVFAANPRIPGLALTHVQQALKCDPQYAPALLTRASLLAVEGNLPEARRSLATMLAGPLSPELRHQATLAIEQVEKRLEDRANARSESKANPP